MNVYRPFGIRPVEPIFEILVDTLDTPFNEEIADSAASGSIAPRLDVPAVLARSTSRYVVASVERVHRILTEFESGVSGIV